MTKKQKTIIISIFVIILLAAAVLGIVLNNRASQDGVKSFQVEIISERDNYYQTWPEESDAEMLGDYLRAFEDCEWEEKDYGIFITGFYGMKEDYANQYWWCVTVNDKEIPYGADEIMLMDGNKYTFTLMQGW